MVKKMWRWFKAPHPRYALGALLVVGALAGLAAFGGFHAALETTNTEAFCISCHTMHDKAYQEYTNSVHYKNASGVRATCPDCHVPKDFGAKLVAKTLATRDLYHQLLGTIDTPEKYEENRLRMARIVWARMEANDSRECRSCHSGEAMDFHKMKKPEEAERMRKGMEAGETCIACHRGMAHTLPDLSQGFHTMIKEITETAAKSALKKNDSAYSFRTATLFADVTKASPEDAGDGKLIAFTPAKVIDTQGDWLKIRLDGWQQEGAERVIYAFKGQRVLNAALGPDLVEKISRETPAEDPETGLIWSRVALEAWVQKGNLLPNPAALTAYGDEMYRGACSGCHALPPPGHTLANQWPGVLNAMKRFISLDDEEYRFLQKYLQLNAKDTGGKGHG